MYSKLSLLFFLLIATLGTSAQDVIHLMDSTTIDASVKNITPRNITYKRTDNPNGPDFILDVNKVHHLSLAGGREVGVKELHPKGMPHQRLTREQARHLRRSQPPLPEVLQLKIAPSSLFDPWSMMLPVYAEYDFAKHFGIELMAAVPFNKLPLANINNRPPVVKGISQDSKYSLSIVNYIHAWKNGRLYLGGEANMRHQQLSLGQGKMRINNVGVIQGFQSADLSKTYYGGGIKFGITTRIAAGLWFDGYLGLGYMAGHSHHTNLQGLDPSYGYDQSTYPFNDNNITNTAEGTASMLYIPFALRLSYHFNHPKNQ